jgi:hypothetical protein
MPHFSDHHLEASQIKFIRKTEKHNRIAKVYQIKRRKISASPTQAVDSLG